MKSQYFIKLLETVETYKMGTNKLTFIRLDFNFLSLSYYALTPSSKLTSDVNYKYMHDLKCAISLKNKS